MTREELIKILDFLPVVASKAPLLKAMVEAQEVGGHGTLSEFIINTLKQPAAPTASITKTETLERFLKEVYESGYKFEDCYDPEMLMDFCSLEGGNRQLTYDQLSEGQRRTIRLIQMKYRQWRKGQIRPVPPPEIPGSQSGYRGSKDDFA